MNEHEREMRKAKHNQMTRALSAQVKKKMSEKFPYDPRIRFHEQFLTISGALVATVYMVKGSERQQSDASFKMPCKWASNISACPWRHAHQCPAPHYFGVTTKRCFG
jgi:hypothetical protein